MHGQMQIEEIQIKEPGQENEMKAAIYSFRYIAQEVSFYCCTVIGTPQMKNHLKCIYDLVDVVVFLWDSDESHILNNIEIMTLLQNALGPQVQSEFDGQLRGLMLCCAYNRQIVHPLSLPRIRNYLTEGGFVNSLIWDVDFILGTNIVRAYSGIVREMMINYYSMLRNRGFENIVYDANRARKFFNYLILGDIEDENIILFTSSGMPIIMNPDALPNGFKNYHAWINHPT